MLYYRLVPRESGTPILLTGSATANDEHRHFVASSSTANWTAGDYSCFAWVHNTSTGAKITIDPETGVPGDTSVVVTLQPDPRTITSYDGRSPARKALDAINAVLATWGTNSNIQSYTIGNRSMTFANKGEAVALRSQLKAEVWREENAAAMGAGLPNPRNVRVRFGSA